MTRYRHLITEQNAKWWTLAAMCTALFMFMLDNTVVNVALPSIQDDLGASISGLEWTVNGYTLPFAVLLVTAGRLGDIFGRRRMFMFGVVVFSISSATAGFAPSTGALIASRVLQGVGAAFMMPATLSIITDAFPPEERGRAIGMWAGVSALALAIGPVIGGLLTEHVSWRAIFFLNLPVAAVAVTAALFAVRESRDSTVERRIDYLGVGVLTAGLTALVLALIEGNAWEWGSTRILSLFAAAAVLLIAFAVIERRIRVPMVEFGLLADRTYLGATAVAFVVSFSMLGMFFFLALYMQNILGYSPLEAGVRFLPTTLVIVVVAPLSGRFTDRVGPRWLITAGLSLVAVSLYLFTRIDAATTYADLLPGFVLMGAGIAMTMSPMSTAAMNAVPVAKSGIASGVLTMSRMVGGTLGVAAIGALFQAEVRSKLDGMLETFGIGSAQREQLTDQVGGGQTTEGIHGLSHHQAAAVGRAAHDAFISGLAQSMKLSAAVALAGAVVGCALIRSRRELSTGDGAPVPAAPAEAERVPA
jgi:EmrB/QacA subfamily drug resistance transporter